MRASRIALLAAVFISALTFSQAEASVHRPKRILLLTHNLFYNHDNLADIEAVLPEWGRTAGFEVTSLHGYLQTAGCTRTDLCTANTVDLSIIDDAYLDQFDGIVASTNGELPFSEAGRAALVRFVRQGKGIVFLHQSMVTLYGDRRWGELLGAYAAVGTPSFDTMNVDRRPVVLKREHPDHPAVRDLPAHWTLNDEFASFAQSSWNPAHPSAMLGPTHLPLPFPFSRQRVTVVLSFDSERTDFAGAPAGWQRGGDYPVAWYQNIGSGRTFYTSLGHRRDLWTSDAMFRVHVTGAIRWVLKLE